MFRSKQTKSEASAAEVPLVPLSVSTSLHSDSPRDESKLLPKNWPSAPQQLRTKPSEVIVEIVLDIVFIALSISFLLFGLIVKHYDQAHVEDHPRLTQNLVEATRYVNGPC